MNVIVNEPAEVYAIFQVPAKLVPKKIKWRNRVHDITEIGYAHKEKRGRVLFHIYNVTTPTVYMRMSLDTELLKWTVEEIADED